MADILLTHSFLLRFDPKQFRTGQAYAPLGTLYAAAMLRKTGISFELYDPMFAESPEALVPVLRREKPKILVIYDDGFNYLSKMCLGNMKDSACRMIRAGKEQGATVVICSVDANDHAPFYLDQGADYCILGEGEQTLAELSEALAGMTRQQIPDIPGVSWKAPGGVRNSRPREVITRLDDLPFPAWDLLDMDRYRRFWKRKNGSFTLNLVTTRGCPYGCIWCAKPVYGNHYNARSPENVAAELKLLTENYHPDRIWFADDIFGLKPGWIEEYAAKVRPENLVLPYTIQSRVDLLQDDRTVASLAASGCNKVWLGIESGSQKILDAMRKGTTVEQAEAASVKLKEAGIRQAFFLQLGFPGETREDIDRTIRLITRLLPDDIGISVTYPLPGTPFFEAVKSQMKEKMSWSDSNDLSLLYRSSFSPAFYRYLHRYIHKYYRFRQAMFYLRSFPGKRTSPEKGRIRRILLMPYYYLFSVFYQFLVKRAEHAG
ncbi:MAG TPA: radical SAM protein [Bacteroidales bacterium]|nr:radical SAM protein [Bacteroidales bacterium]